MFQCGKENCKECKIVRLGYLSSRRRYCSGTSQCWSATSHACLRSGSDSLRKTSYCADCWVLAHCYNFINQILLHSSLLTLNISCNCKLPELAKIFLVLWGTKVSNLIFGLAENHHSQRGMRIAWTASRSWWLWRMMRDGFLSNSCILVIRCMNSYVFGITVLGWGDTQTAQMEIARKDKQIRELHDEYAFLSVALNPPLGSWLLLMGGMFLPSIASYS